MRLTRNDYNKIKKFFNIIKETNPGIVHKNIICGQTFSDDITIQKVMQIINNWEICNYIGFDDDIINLMRIMIDILINIATAERIKIQPNINLNTINSKKYIEQHNLIIDIIISSIRELMTALHTYKTIIETHNFEKESDALKKMFNKLYIAIRHVMVL